MNDLAPFHSNPIDHAEPATVKSVTRRADGSTYELPRYANNAEVLREEYKGDPKLEKLAARFAAGMLDEDIKYLRSNG
jgi:hypothetical protein